MRRIIAASTVTCGLTAAAISLAGQASAACDSVDCVPNVARNVVAFTAAPALDPGGMIAAWAVFTRLWPFLSRAALDVLFWPTGLATRT